MNEETASVVAAYVEGLRVGDLEKVRFDPSVEYLGPLSADPAAGVAGVVGFLSTVLMPLLEDVTIHNQIVDGEHACVRATVRVKGVATPIETCDYIHVVSGRIRHIRAYYDPRPMTG